MCKLSKKNQNSPLSQKTILGDSEEVGESGVATIEKTIVKKPSLYKVLIHNDDYTTMEFVIFVLQRFFKTTTGEAQGIMLKVHEEGVGVCGIFTKEIAETKQFQVTKSAEENGHPLKCTIEPEA